MVEAAGSARAAGKVSLAVFLSRILGLVRDQVMAKLFGAGFYNDAWLVAFRIPNLLRDLFAEGALSAAFVPTFTDFLKNRGRSEAWILANLVLSALLVILGVFTLILLFFPQIFVYVLAAGFAEVPGKVEVTSNLLRILSPFLMLVAMAAVAMGILNTLDHFFVPALAPALFNVSVILAGFLLAPQFEHWGILPIHAIAAGALLGGMLQYALQIPLLRQEGYRFRFALNWRHEGVQRIGRLIAPAVVGVSAVQLNVLVNTQIASFLQENGPVSWLNYAFRIIYLPIGVFGVAVGVVHLRDASVSAAQESWADLKETVANSIKLVAFLAVPSMVGLMVLALPIVRVLFERGGFTSLDTHRTAYALIFYSIGLFAYSGLKIYVPTFYALRDTRTPVRISLLAVAANFVLNLLLVFVLLREPYRYLGLALGTSFSVVLNNLLLAKRFRERFGDLRDYAVTVTTLKITIAALLMGTVVLFLNGFLQGRWAGMGFAYDVGALVFCVAIGAAVYFAACRALGIEQMNYLLSRWRT